MSDPRVVVLADDLIWAERLSRLLSAVDAQPWAARSAAELGQRLPSADAVVIDLTARSYDPIAAIERSARAGRRVLAVGQHDDIALRKRALAAGAERVFAYRKVFEDGEAVLRSWLAVRPTTPAAIPGNRYRRRLEAVREGLARTKARALLIGPGADLLYLAGYEAPALERLTLLVVPVRGDVALIVPRLERELAAGSVAVSTGLADLRSWEETEDPLALVAASVGDATLGSGGAATARAGKVARLLVGDRLWATFLLRLESAFPGISFGVASQVLRELRMRKDEAEIALLRAAAQAADRVFAAVAAGPLIGRTERDVAHEISERLVAEGHDSAEDAIVASGPSAASPHHAPGERRIEAGQPVVLDFGGRLGGYMSDVTRTLWVTGPQRTPPDREFVHLYETVRAAHAAALSAVRPGVSCESVDGAARERIAEAGYGPFFLHRTGHGIGLEAHEDPYLVGGNRQTLAAGMTFSIEPGIYLEGRCGARLEDIVACTTDGPDVLNEASRDLAVVPG